jgi:hypothetical protein
VCVEVPKCVCDNFAACDTATASSEMWILQVKECDVDDTDGNM